MANDSRLEPRPDEDRVLLLPPTSRDSDAIRKLLAAEGIACAVVQGMPELCEAITQGAGAVVVSEESLIADHRGLTAFVRGQPVWSDMPIIVLSRSGAEFLTLTAVLSRLGNVSVLERPVRVTTLVSIVRSALRARDRQYQVRAHLSERKRAEEELRGSEERLRLAVQTGKLGVWDLDLQTNEMTCSSSCKANFGRGETASFTIDDFWASLHPDEVPRVREAIRDSVTQQAEYDIEYRIIWPDGTIHWVLARGRLASTSNGSPQRMVGVTLDITDRKTIEEQRTSLLEAERAARGEAERAGQMKDEFLATLSHELRTPLNAILGWTQILKAHPLNVEDTREGVNVIARNARAQTQIIEDLLDMNRIIAGKIRLDIQQVDIAEVIRAAVETVKLAADVKDIEVRAILDSQPATVAGDPNRLQQIFWNLFSNAVKFTPKGGKVQARLNRVESHLEISVTDTGEGIDPEFLPHVFDRFRQADATTTRRHGGLGLGLAIVKQLVELHGGSVRARSPGKTMGSSFIVSLPLSVSRFDPAGKLPRRHVPADAACAPANAGDQIAGLRVLVVDDEPDARALLKRLLEDGKAEVFTAASADEAVAILVSKRPDVIISDIGMPGEDGYTFIRRVRALPPNRGGNTPAVALTAYARDDDRINAIAAGFQSHIPKPVEPADLIASVASLANRIPAAS